MHKNNSYQFLHLEKFVLKPRKNSKHPSAEAVAREYQRVDQSYPHIATPKEPELLYGITPMEALERVKNLVKEFKDPLGRKVRSDTQIVSFGVASIKVESTDENWNSPKVKKWLKNTENYLKKRFGKQFVSLVKHSGQRFCHMHFCIMPTKDKKGFFRHKLFAPRLSDTTECQCQIKIG